MRDRVSGSDAERADVIEQAGIAKAAVAHLWTHAARPQQGSRPDVDPSGAIGLFEEGMRMTGICTGIPQLL